MGSALKIMLALIILLVSFDGLRVSTSSVFGPGISMIFALLGVGVPYVMGIYIRHRAGLKDAVIDAGIALWPLCVMRLWPIAANLKQWGYSYTLSASEGDVVAFILYLIAISAWSFLNARSLNRNAETLDADKVDDEKGEKPKPYPLWGVICAILFLIALPLWLGLIRHSTFHSKAWDLAIFSQLAYNILHGNGLEVSVRGLKTILSDHFSPIMFLAAFLSQPFGGGAKGLIILQALAAASGIIPLSLAHARRNPPNYLRWNGLLLIYALYIPLTFLLLDDFHPIAFVVPLFLWAFYFLETKRMWLCYAFFLLAGCCQEEVWIVVGMVGLYLALFRGMRSTGIILFIVSWAIFFFLVIFLIPSFRPEGDYFYIHRYAYLGESAGEIVKNIFLRPWLWLKRMFDGRSIAFILMMLAPLGFLSLRRPKMLFMLIPVAFYTLISGYDIQRSIFHQYVAPFIPFLILSTLDNFRDNGDRKYSIVKQQLALGSVWCGICACAMVLLFHVQGFTEIYSTYGLNGFDAKLDRHFVGIIEEDDKVSTISKYASHLSNRKHLTLFPNLEWDGEWPGKVLVDGKELITREERQMLAELLYKINEGPDYDLLHFYNGVFLFEKASDLPPWERTLAAATPSTEGMRAADGGEVYQIAKIKFADLVPFRAGNQEIDKLVEDIRGHLYWLKIGVEVGGDFTHDWFLAVRCEDEDGNPLFVYHHFPVYGPFYDVELKPGETRPARIFNRAPRFLRETYVIDTKIHRPKPVHRYKNKSGLPARLRILPMRLPEGWTNRLDEYVTARNRHRESYGKMLSWLNSGWRKTNCLRATSE